MNKYKSVKTKYNGITFHSKKEAEYAKLLDMLKKASDLENRVVSYAIQVPYDIYINDQKICRYLADFKVKYADGRTEVVDVKGFRTPIYKLKKKLVEAQHGIEIIEY